ncbi:hypothetical protein COLU111180_04710 [Cohnella lubricantis]|uniref:Uncharacterized protein n=1 Tax=Cohnella lubricantis TaxID=2163172 RepID=A0A841T776_9BACL|nr:hypothetical protein [Cohnella lubricantis]MBB6677184.1 hypothetical protein [Cohnella lubricantis]MBP2117005.1 hypothetical protein [Cohnella lubricantis]
MRTTDQVKRKYNELAAQKQTLEEKLAAADPAGETANLEARIARLEEQMLLLEWVLNEPMGSYHG